MFPNSHYEFILTPITKVLKDAVSASCGVGGGIETYPLYDYVMQSLFLKMTGFQEQKMKCICWDIATVDYEYRYEFTKNPLGECSSYKEKNEIYKGILKQIKKHGIELNDIGLNKKNIWQTTLDDVENIFSNTNLSVWAQKNFNNFKKDLSNVSQSSFLNQINGLFEQVLQDVYVNHLYKQRNRIAHNTLSYQQNLPSLKTLINENYKYENYFVYFSILVLIDKIFIELYKCYMKLVEEIN
jgi:hypothetical protein